MVSRETQSDDLNAARPNDQHQPAAVPVDAIGPSSTADEHSLPCGHHESLRVVSAETGETLYCELCDDKSGRRDAEMRERELSAKVAELEARGWFSVDDRLPAPQTHVLAAFEMDGPGDWRIKVACFEPDSRDASVISQSGWRIYGGGWVPTHWMPLPTAPSGTPQDSGQIVGAADQEASEALRSNDQSNSDQGDRA